jgi:hypothetical protein
MSLSIQKLEKLLSNKGFIPLKYFIMDSFCVYMEIVSVSDTDVFLLYIPSKYKFTVKKADNVYKIKYVDIDADVDNTADEYAGKSDDHITETVYTEIDIDVSPTVKGGNIAPHLEENYKRIINLNDISNNDSTELKDVIRQLKRLRFCVQNVKYKITIMYKNYICSIKRDDSIECYSITNYLSKKSIQLYITTDLELLYTKMDSCVSNMKILRKGIYNILDKNHIAHTRILKKLLEEKGDFMEYSDIAYTNKIKYEKYIQESNQMLEVITNSEKTTIEQLYEINQQYNDNGLKGLHNDIEKSRINSSLNKELANIKKIKEDVVKNLLLLKTKRDDTMLRVDKIMFDNSVMLDAVFRNFLSLGEIARVE